LIGRLILDGHSGVWVPNAEVRHFIPVERMTSAYLWNYHLGRGRTSVRSKGLHTCKLLWGLPRWVVRQYWTARIRSLVLYPLRGGAWLRATRRAAFLKGVMVETQNIRSAPE
jgi:hypothetical protein